MGRIRTVKPELFTHEGLADLELESGLPVRLAFVGLFCQADREGRFKWRPRTLKIQILPFDDVDFTQVLDALGRGGFIVRYESAGESFGWIPSFTTHQVINNREAASQIPPPPDNLFPGKPAAVDGTDERPAVTMAEPAGESSPAGGGANQDATSTANTTSNSRGKDASATRGPRVKRTQATREADAQGEGKGRERKGRNQEGNQKSTPPPGSTLSAGNANSVDWAVVGDQLLGLGVSRAQAAIAAAKAAGASPEDVLGVMRVYMAHPARWGPGALYERVVACRPGQDPQSLWPPAENSGGGRLSVSQMFDFLTSGWIHRSGPDRFLEVVADRFGADVRDAVEHLGGVEWFRRVNSSNAAKRELEFRAAMKAGVA